MATSLSMPDAIASSSDAGRSPLDLSSNAARDALLSIGEMGEIADAPAGEMMHLSTHPREPTPTNAISTSASSKIVPSIIHPQKQLDDLQAAIRDLRSDNEALRAEIAQLKLDQISSVSALCSEIARLQATMLSLKTSLAPSGLPRTPSGLPNTLSALRCGPSALPFTTSTLAATSSALPAASSALATSSNALAPTMPGPPFGSSASSFPATVALSSSLRQPPSQPSSKLLRARATLLAAERAEALLAGLSEEARQAVRTESRRGVRSSAHANSRLSALFSASGSTSKLPKQIEHERPLSLSRNEAVDALAASHAIMELQQLCDLHGNSNHGSFDSLLSEDSRGSGSADWHIIDSNALRALDSDGLRASTPISADTVSVYSARGSSPEKLSVSPLATLTATPSSRSDVSLRTNDPSTVEPPDAPSGVHPLSLIKIPLPSDILASAEGLSPANHSETTIDMAAKPPSPMVVPPHQRLVSSNSKSRIPIPLGWRRLNSSSPPSPPLSLTTFAPGSKSSSPDGSAERDHTERMMASGSAGIAPGKGSRMSEDQRGSPMYGSVALSGVPQPF
ncbi:uncharacterized protein SCHCODRAFT_02639279 [Schizophyllum commune H4-8]|uniref:uncharacterized protein n=1 Tax=Schizophyllum commune (strain H4-8 / FGSC 9210) TaxID=578458 RepID=UPI00215EE27B|nr:uncharacterized protein SCHCODRAFT_02639279 [Schizophyllum commune H4-8]KAI5887934.1 hypothetical protein SCHCODRAFT_02639279 [Schizophyllum commune H4-8]